MMLLLIENWYFYGLKISEPQVHQLKESYLEDLEPFRLQQMSKLWETICCVTFENMAKVKVKVELP